MASGKGLIPVEAYIESRRSDGYSCDEIMKALQKKGYTEEVIALSDKTYHYRLTIKVLSIVSVIAVLISVGLALWKIQAPSGAASPLITLSPEQVALHQVMACQGESDASLRVACIAKNRGAVESVANNEVNPSDPQYGSYVQSVIISSALRNDLLACAVLKQSEQDACEKGLPLLRASLMGDPRLCEQIQGAQGVQSGRGVQGGVHGVNQKRACVLDILGRQDPQKVQELQEQLAKVSADAMEKGDASLCQSLEFNFAKSDCGDKVSVHDAIKAGSQKACEAVSDNDQRLYCLNAVLHKFEENR